MRVEARALVAAGALLAGCGTFRATRAPLGDPPVPAARISGVDTREAADAVDIYEVERRGSDGFGPVSARVTRAGYHAEDASDDVVLATDWDVRLDGGPAGVEIRSMTWSSPTAPRCQGEHVATDFLLDPEEPLGGLLGLLRPEREVHWERPLVVRGDRVLSGRFVRDDALLRRPSVVDVLLVPLGDPAAREVCVRVPATGPDVTYWSEKRWSVGSRLGWRRGTAFSPSSELMIAASLGRWAGPIRVGVEGIIGGSAGTGGKDSASGTALCFAVEGRDCDDVFLGGFAVEASGLFAALTPVWRLGWTTAYEQLFATVDRTDPTTGAHASRDASSGSLRLGLQLLAASPRIMGVAPRSPTGAAGLEVYAAGAHEWTGVAAGHRLTFGVSLVAF